MTRVAITKSRLELIVKA